MCEHAGVPAPQASVGLCGWLCGAGPRPVLSLSGAVGGSVTSDLPGPGSPGCWWVWSGSLRGGSGVCLVSYRGGLRLGWQGSQGSVSPGSSGQSPQERGTGMSPGAPAAGAYRGKPSEVTRW